MNRPLLPRFGKDYGWGTVLGLASVALLPPSLVLLVAIAMGASVKVVLGAWALSSFFMGLLACASESEYTDPQDALLCEHAHGAWTVLCVLGYAFWPRVIWRCAVGWKGSLAVQIWAEIEEILTCMPLPEHYSPHRGTKGQ